MMSTGWLQKLKLDQLHRLASLTGSYCSGNKQARIAAIEQAVQHAALLSATSKSHNGDALRIVSIDMGIRNLAYCTLHAQRPRASSTSPDVIAIGAWQRVAIGSASLEPPPTKKKNKTATAATTPSTSTETAAKESFEPHEYAKHAYSFIKGILDTHNPTHILIERQRFRSGGGAAVQEWTIRVGVFEAMLYATLRTLAEQKYCSCSVVPVAPAMVNRFWLPGAEEGEAETPPARHLGSAKRQKGTRMKQRKIRLLDGMLRNDRLAPTTDHGDYDYDHDQTRLMFDDEAAQSTKEEFLARKAKATGITPKLDDLADSLLQGLAWLAWQRNRLNLGSVAQREFGGP